LDAAEADAALKQEPQPERQILEAELIRRICEGEKELFYPLIQPYERSVYLAARSMARDESEAEDIAQDTFLKAFRSLPSFRFESRFSTWLERIAINEGRMRLRRMRSHKSEPLTEDETDSEDYVPLLLSDWREIPSEALERKEVHEMLERALFQLPENYREVLIMRDIEELSIAETAETLGLTVTNVKTRLLRARLKLRDLIAPQQASAAVISRNLFQKGRKPW
jgi:RNA polymerase sigma-70 factor, ECF subfamily